ncbi:efflux transporter outer membrane subunit [Ramlibacter solisilvae]|uniref:efflux transporter outer membrane subunit n=1 Tax=Ramlibacter tataouinensis TaxID=94132 RepID=UPI0007774955|nr:efflux transporter outer membrane subunit [Ramlibacter tataouinensis]
MASKTRIAAFAAFAAVGLLVAGCTLGPNYQRPSLAVPEKYRFAETTPGVAGAAESAWWQGFNDPALDALVAEALAANYDLEAAAARVDRFNGLLTVTRSGLYPQVSAQLGGTRQRLSDRSGTVVPADNPFNSVTGSLLASWEIDLFGRVRRQSEAALAALRGSEEFRRGVVLSVVSSVAASYVRLRDLDRQLEVARDTVGIREDALRVFERRFRGGVVSEVEVQQARSELAAAQRTVPTLQQSIAQEENALSVLVGRNPGPIARGKPIDQLALPAVPAGLPSSVLERRPDVREAEQALVSANAGIGAARALYFPSISLTGALGVASTSLSGLSSASQAWSYGAAATMPIFTGGAISGQVQSAEAATREAVAQYRRAVQVAFRETEDALVGVEKTVQARDTQLRQVQALQRYSIQSRKRYEGGYTSYLEVLDADRSLFNAQLDLSQTQADVLLQHIALYKALAGGWVDLADRPTPKPLAAEQAAR